MGKSLGSFSPSTTSPPTPWYALNYIKKVRFGENMKRKQKRETKVKV
jgi:hypothetical protein